MKNVFIYCLLVSLIFYGCEERNNDVTPYNGSTNWEDSYAGVLHGASSIKIEVALTHPGTIYYLVSEKPLEQTDAEFIKEQAIKASNSAIIKNGLMVVTSTELGDTSAVVADGLKPESEYYSYIVMDATTEEGSTSSLQDIVKSFTSLLFERQKVNSINSSVMGNEMLYLSYALEDYYLNPKKAYPLLIFLHGMGEYAKEGEINLYRNTAIPQLINNGNEYPFIVISPQLNTGSWSPDYVDELITKIVKEYRIDESRIYMTGMSLGGIGTWNYVLNYPERLAAVVPISGSGSPSKACNMKNIPVWAFHNATDGMVNTAGSVDMIEALKACDPACPVAPKLTLYPDAGHNAWVRTYNGSAGYDIFSWLLTYKKN